MSAALQTPASPGVFSRMFGAALDMVGPISVLALLAIVAAFVIQSRVEKQLAQALSDRPQIAIVDDFALVRLAISNGADRYNPAAVTAEIERIVTSAGMGDTILLSRSMVLYSPPGSEIPVVTPEPEARQPTRQLGP